ncbi:ATP-binding protein [bacterium]|nr:ATP-binding protein [bacterium]
MLVRFSVENFKSIREEQTLSMVASNYEKELPENVIELDVLGLKGVNLLKSAVIYGANASGKSNLLKAMEFMRNFVENSATEIKPGEDIKIEPFLLDSESQGEPTSFEMTIIVADVRFDYGFSLDDELVHEEWLIGYPKGRPSVYFERELEENGYYAYRFGRYVKKDINLLNKTRDNNLFLSIAAQFNNEQLLPIYNWFSTQLLDIGPATIMGLPFKSSSSNAIVQKSGELKEQFLTLLRWADSSIEDVQLKPVDIDLNEMPGEFKQFLDSYNDLLEKAGGVKLEELLVDARFKRRKTENGEHAEFTVGQESSGTLRLYSILGPFLQVNENGVCAFIDELDTSLHPHILRNLIIQFNSNDFNTAGAQLIFTTHDSTLLSADLFRRDQIWLTEKSYEGNTVLYPLSDYKVRKGESLQKGYLAGRYGAIPFFGSNIVVNE